MDYYFFVPIQSVSANEFDFSVEPVFPENQLDKSISYFDLQMDAGQEQAVTVVLKNDTSQRMVIDVEVASATTNTNGTVEYSRNEIKTDQSLLYNMEDLISVPQEVVLEGNATQELIVMVNMPKTRFEGVIAGGLTFRQKKQEETSQSQEDQGIKISNESEYVMGVLLQQQKEIMIQPELNLTKIEAKQVNARNVFAANIQNSKPVYAKKIQVDAVVSEIGNKKNRYALTKEGMQMAPNSNFDFLLPLNGKKFIPGKYKYEVDIYSNPSDLGTFTGKKSPSGTQSKFLNHWHYEKEFEISKEQAEELNQSDITLQENDEQKVSPQLNSWVIIGAGSVFLILIGIIIYQQVQGKKKRNESKPKSKK